MTIKGAKAKRNRGAAGRYALLLYEGANVQRHILVGKIKLQRQTGEIDSRQCFAQRARVRGQSKAISARRARKYEMQPACSARDIRLRLHVGKLRIGMVDARKRPPIASLRARQRERRLPARRPGEPRDTERGGLAREAFAQRVADRRSIARSARIVEGVANGSDRTPTLLDLEPLLRELRLGPQERAAVEPALATYRADLARAAYQRFHSVPCTGVLASSTRRTLGTA